MTRRPIAFAAVVVLAGPVLAQQPGYQPPANDKGRQPAYPSGGNRFDENRTPVIASPNAAGIGAGMIQSFPAPGMGGAAVVPQQQFAPASPPPLSPYLNLARGFNRGGGLSAIDYYNFVRPITQPTGPVVSSGGTGMAFPYNRPAANLDPSVQLTPDAVLRPAGTPGAFMNYGGYFNRMGTIGFGARPGGRR
jgi:hypothetical protein